MNGEIEEHCGGEECHLPAEGWAVEALERFLGEHGDAGKDHKGQAAE